MSTPTNSYVRAKAPKQKPATTYTGSADAIDITRGDIHILNRSGGVNAATIAAPTDETDDGREIWIKNGTTQANTLTVTGGLGGSGSSYDVITFGAVVAANATLRAYQGQWYLIGSHEATIA